MARGKKTSIADREAVIAAYRAGESHGEIAKRIGIGKSTVTGIINSYKSSDDDEALDQLRTNMSAEAIKKAEAVLSDILELMFRKIGLAKGNVEALMQMKLNELSSAFGTIFDRVEVMRSRRDEIDGGGVVEIPTAEPLEPPEDGEDDE